MSRSHKKPPKNQYRSPKGSKQAKISNARNIPPNKYDDKKFDNQCYVIFKIMEKMFAAGIEFKTIENKLRSDYKIKHHEWVDITYYYFPSSVDVYFQDLIALNEDCSEFISINTPYTEPLHMVKLDSLPIDGNLIIRKNDILRFKKDEKGNINKIHQWPNKNWTEILLNLRNHYEENGMNYWYTIQKWKMGWKNCICNFLEYEE